MTGIVRALTNVASRALERDEREAVMGDVLEGGGGAWGGLSDVLSLVVLRQASLWKCWRPWLAAIGLTLPGSLLLMGASLSVSQACLQFMGPTTLRPAGTLAPPDYSSLLCHSALLVGCAWTGGFAVGSLSRRTVWASALLCISPCAFCLARFRVESASKFSLLLFLPPAIWGMWRGLRSARGGAGRAAFLAPSLTLLTVWAWAGRGPRAVDLVLLLPAWYIAVAAAGAKLERADDQV